MCSSKCGSSSIFFNFSVPKIPATHFEYKSVKIHSAIKELTWVILAHLQANLLMQMFDQNDLQDLDQFALPCMWFVRPLDVVAERKTKNLLMRKWLPHFL